MEKQVQYFQIANLMEILQSYNNLETVTGRECFEINLDDIER